MCSVRCCMLYVFTCIILSFTPQVSPQPQLGQYVSMHRPQSEANSDGLCDYEAMAMNTTSSDSESEDDDAYVNCTSGQKGSGT